MSDETKQFLAEEHSQNEIVDFFRTPEGLANEWAMAVAIQELSEMRFYLNQYQIWTGLNATLKSGEQIWALKIAHHGDKVFGEIYRTEEEAKAAIPAILKELRNRNV